MPDGVGVSRADRLEIAAPRSAFLRLAREGSVDRLAQFARSFERRSGVAGSCSGGASQPVPASVPDYARAARPVDEVVVRGQPLLGLVPPAPGDGIGEIEAKRSAQ